jgi:predicted DNA-binding transcriptional regulator AlpA
VRTLKASPNLPDTRCKTSRHIDESQSILLDVNQVAALLNISSKAVRCRIEQRLLPHRRWGGSVIFLRAEIEHFFIKALPGVTLDEARANTEARAKR